MNFNQILTHWYSDNKRNLPWRKTKDPYCIWLSEIILQQTRVDQGLPYYESFSTAFPTVFELANATEEQVLKLWQGLGYYSRARNLHFTAKYIASELNGEFPNTYTGLIKLKGVGDYTASAIASICFNEATAVVDGNVYRVLSRYFGIDTPINSTKGIKEFKTLAQTLLPKEDIGNYNQAIMEFGAKQCKPASPNCDVCPLNNSCLALAKKRVNELPIKLKKTKVTKKHFNFLVFVSNNKHTLLEQRTENGIWKNLYQFPLIETTKSISINALKANEAFKQILNSSKAKITLHNSDEIIHKLSHQHLYTKFWIVEVDQLPKEGIPIKDIHDFPVPILIGKFIDEFNRI
jgi:A/G-specific adenine glycosylase